MEYIGIAMLITPFIALFVAIGKLDGWMVALGLYAAAIIFVWWLAVAIHFIRG